MRNQTPQRLLLVLRRVLVLLCLTSLCVSTICAQIKPSRSWLVDMARRPTVVGAIPSMMGGAEVYRGWGSFEHEQAWQLRLHAVAEPYRFTSDSYVDSSIDTSAEATVASFIAWTTSLEFHHELTSNPMNDIGFNPRTARWEEQLLVHAAGSWWSARAGWFHRCKHDIDNTEAPNEDTAKVYSPIRRTLILSGPTLGAMTAPISIRDWSFRFAAGAEWYVVNADYRTPAASLTGSWKGMQGAFSFQGDASWTLSERFLIGAHYYMSVPCFTSRYDAQRNTVLPLDARAELTATIFYWPAAIDVVLSAEHMFDEVAFLSATPSTHYQFGLRFRSR